MNTTEILHPELSAEARRFYLDTMRVLEDAGVPCLVGGAFAFTRYTGVERQIHDFDLFVREEHLEAGLTALSAAGYGTEVKFPHWLGKVYSGDAFVDLIFNSGNGVARVDDAWFEHAVSDTVLDRPVALVPAEEMIWSKAFVQERERFDGADVQHLLYARAAQLEWQRLLDRFGENWRVLFGHLVLFGYIYPSESDRVPAWVMRALMARLERTLTPFTPGEDVCRGTLLSRQQYLVDVNTWGYEDARTRPENPMTDTDIALWTDSIREDGSN